MVSGFKIRGKNKLNGVVKISGSKNASLPIMAATLLSKGTYILSNIPNLKDIETMSDLLKTLGMSVTKIEENSLKVENFGIMNMEAPYDLVKKMRASFLVMGPLLANLKVARVSLPGGCAIGARPINYHLSGFESLGAEVTIEHGYVEARAKELVGNKIIFDFPSVGATENLLMASVMAKGETIIENAAREPEIDDLVNFLNKMGAKITGIGSSTLKILGVNELHAANHSIVADRIEAGTFIIAAILNNGGIEIENVNVHHLEKFIQILEENGAKFEIKNNTVKILSKLKDLKPFDISTAPYPGFPTDLQAQTMLLLSLIEGESKVSETVFENRFMHIPELDRLGTKIEVDGHIALIKGVGKLSGASVMASDLRAGASLVLAALNAEGETIISRVYHIDRGYEKLEIKLKKIGAEIQRIQIGV